MHDTLTTSSEQLARARGDGDPAAVADALLRHADALVRAGRLDEATRLADEAAALHGSRGAADDQRRCRLLAAEMLRLQGRRGEAAERVHGLLSGMDVHGAEAAPAQALLGEIALGDGDAAAAELFFTQALDAQPQGAPAWWRGRARARAALGQFELAAQDLDTARAGCELQGDFSAARRAVVEAAALWQQVRRFDRAARLVDDTMDAARAASDHTALGALELLSATNALERSDAAAARAHALAAREHALQARAADTYIGAAVALSRLADHAGDRPEAYAVLATGWATLSDLLGSELARRTFEPLLRDLHKRWGAQAFEAVRKSYEAARRTSRGAQRHQG